MLETDDQGIPYYIHNDDVEHMVDKQTESTRALGKVAIPKSEHYISRESLVNVSLMGWMYELVLEFNT